MLFDRDHSILGILFVLRDTGRLTCEPGWDVDFDTKTRSWKPNYKEMYFVEYSSEVKIERNKDENGSKVRSLSTMTRRQ